MGCRWIALAFATGGAVVLACSGGGSGPATGVTPPNPVITSTARSSLFVVREHMLAAVEMQLSGEPFATTMGRNLTDYSRDWRPPNIYFDTSPGSKGPWVDLAGFSSAIESYEYSKQPMNTLAFESGAGLSLAYGPLLNPVQDDVAGCAALRQWVQKLGTESYAVSPPPPGAQVAPPPHPYFSATATADNPLGWPGIWPTLEPFVSFDPTINPTNAVDERCSITSDDDPGATAALVSDDYECDANSLHLADRASQVTSAISPGSSGWAGWKSALWVMNYLQIMHDVDETPVTQLQAGFSLSQVGQPYNGALGVDLGTQIGTYLGSSDIEGFQAGMMILAMDNEADDWLLSRTTTDGVTLGGFADLPTALAYDMSAPLRWFPGQIAVTEATTAGCAFPKPASFSITDGGSHLLDLAGLLGTYSSLYALTDQANSQVGGSEPCMAYFDGDPFPADDGVVPPDGDSTLHDRALGMIRVLLVNLQRMHVDPASGIPVDDVTVSGGVPTRGPTLSATTAAYGLLALRTARRTLSDQLVLYLNSKPDQAVATTPIDSPQLASSGMTSITALLDTDITALANLFYDQLTDGTGHASAGWNVATKVPTSQEDLLDSHTAAVRGLLQAFLATGDTKYRDRALAVFERVDATFWDPVARIYRPVAGDTSNSVVFTPVHFALIQAMLRDTYELIAADDGRGTLATLILSRVARLNKVVLDGWDDRNDNQLVDYPEECVGQPVAGASDPGGGASHGGLQMAERTLTGETGSVTDTFDAGARVIAKDRQPNCVPEISVAHLPAALADSITLQITSPP
jgi:hypothetical protein